MLQMFQNDTVSCLVEVTALLFSQCSVSGRLDTKEFKDNIG